jgi:hypothetical protein
MRSGVNSAAHNATTWMFYKTMRVAIHGLHVDESSVSMVKGLLKDNKKVVFVPIYKSFADPFILNFVNHHFKFDIPF